MGSFWANSLEINKKHISPKQWQINLNFISKEFKVKFSVNVNKLFP